jgi:curli production assembly/transport component CsgG/holdfast attachment protein HfaB
MKFKSTKAVTLVGALSLLAGCVGPGQGLTRVQLPDQHAPFLLSGAVSQNQTPYDPVFKCFGGQIAGQGLSIAVGDVRDYTGKSSDGEGFAITQGGALMAYSALGKMAPGVVIHERFDTRIADAELAYMTQRQLGDGRKHQLPATNAEDPAPEEEVPWLPYFGGSILKSKYYIVGGITELNYNIRSGGGELQIDSVGPKAREYVMNVAVDLRIVDTESLKVLKTVSVQKQVVGYEIGFDLFRFFGDTHYDLYGGAKSQEPIQFAVRLAIEDSVLQLVSSVAKKDPASCLSAAWSEQKNTSDAK